MKPVFRNVLAGAVLVAVGAVAGPWIYINLVKQDAPEALTLEPAVTTTVDEVVVETVVEPVEEVSAVKGQWVVAADSVVGYRAKEVIVAQKTEGVGRTSAVTGVLTITDEQVTGAEFTVDMTTLKSDSSRRDRQVNTRILDTATYPTATFVMNEPIVLTAEALAGSDLTAKVRGTLTLRGVTKDIDVTLIARLIGDVIEVNGSIELVFAEWSIPDPSLPGIVVEDRGQLEFLLRFTR